MQEGFSQSNEQRPEAHLQSSEGIEHVFTESFAEFRTGHELATTDIYKLSNEEMQGILLAMQSFWNDKKKKVDGSIELCDFINTQEKKILEFKQTVTYGDVENVLDEIAQHLRMFGYNVAIK